MTRAEEKALKAIEQKLITEEAKASHFKQGYIEGYMQAEKDFINFVHQHYPLNYVGWTEDFNREFGND